MVFVSLPERQRENPFQVQAALERGAAAVICDSASPAPARSACVQVADARAAFSQTAALFHQHPSRQLQVFGIGGEPESRGRVSALLADLLSACGQDAAWLGAEGCRAGGRCLPWPADRLDAFQIQAQLAAHLQSGGRSCVIELLPGLVAGGQLAAIDFTARVTAELAGQPTLMAERLTVRGSRLRLELGGHSLSVHTPLVGRAQIHALAQAASLAFGAGMPVKRIAAALTRLPFPAGFLEPVRRGQPFGVLVDGARNALSLTLALRDARELATGRLVVLTGPSPEHSFPERCALAETAFELADEVIVTSDQARPEEFAGLAAEFVGRAPRVPVRVEADRHQAIGLALQGRRRGDVVVLAGKGPAGTQRLGASVVPWDERRHAGEALACLGFVGGEL